MGFLILSVDYLSMSFINEIQAIVVMSKVQCQLDLRSRDFYN